jgi:hypothetical protein
MFPDVSEGNTEDRSVTFSRNISKFYQTILHHIEQDSILHIRIFLLFLKLVEGSSVRNGHCKLNANRPLGGAPTARDLNIFVFCWEQ